MDDKKMPLKCELETLYTSSAECMSKNLEEGNKLWYGVIRLIITLSSSFLLLSLALVEKLFKIEAVIQVTPMLAIAWITLFGSIIFGIMQEIEGTIFYNKLAKDFGERMREYVAKISKGETHTIVDASEKSIVFSNIVCGVTAINAFLIAIISLSLALLEKSLNTGSFVTWGIFVLGIVGLVGIDINFLTKYSKIKSSKTVQ